MNHLKEGIDIRGFDPKESKYICVQCKQVKSFSSSDLKSAVKLFESGQFYERTNVFILCIRTKIDKDFEDTLIDIENRLKQDGIFFKLWDEKELNNLLKKYPQIVLDLFGAQWVKDFNGEQALEKLIYRPSKIKYEAPKYYQSRILHWERKDNDKGVLTTSVNIFKNSIEKIPNLVLIKSEATIGKSTELKFIAHYYSSIEKEIYFPILISLKNYVNENISDLIRNYVAEWEHIPKKELLLLLDGLDEVKTEERENFIRRLGQFIESNPDVTIILSSRTNFVI